MYNTTEEGLFGKIKQCEYCKRPLPSNYEGALCPVMLKNISARMK